MSRSNRRARGRRIPLQLPVNAILASNPLACPEHPAVTIRDQGGKVDSRRDDIVRIANDIVSESNDIAAAKRRLKRTS